MFELVINTSFSTVVAGPAFTAPDDAVLFINGGPSAVAFTVTQVGTSNVWTVTFTPVSTGVYSFFAFGEIQFRAQCSNKSLYTFLANIEDESLGSWSWDKITGTLTVLRQNGSLLATHTVTDSLTVSSRERIS